MKDYYKNLKINLDIDQEVINQAREKPLTLSKKETELVGRILGINEMPIDINIGKEILGDNFNKFFNNFCYPYENRSTNSGFYSLTDISLKHIPFPFFSITPNKYFEEFGYEPKKGAGLWRLFPSSREFNEYFNVPEIQENVDHLIDDKLRFKPGSEISLKVPDYKLDDLKEVSKTTSEIFGPDLSMKSLKKSHQLYLAISDWEKAAMLGKFYHYHGRSHKKLSAHKYSKKLLKPYLGKEYFLDKFWFLQPIVQAGFILKDAFPYRVSIDIRKK